mmetsp:Transcript_28802/g.71802  ORF Transcript_28802/g.71802 Transcript_28802/m.71802 type:complete len:228 (-) Transcript_28802:467-1150(-)
MAARLAALLAARRTLASLRSTLNQQELPAGPPIRRSPPHPCRPTRLCQRGGTPASTRRAVCHTISTPPPSKVNGSTQPFPRQQPMGRARHRRRPKCSLHPMGRIPHRCLPKCSLQRMGRMLRRRRAKPRLHPHMGLMLHRDNSSLQRMLHRRRITPRQYLPMPRQRHRHLLELAGVHPPQHLSKSLLQRQSCHHRGMHVSTRRPVYRTTSTQRRSRVSGSTQECERQ